MKIDCRGPFSRSKSLNVFNVMKIEIFAVFVLLQSSLSSENSGRKNLGGGGRVNARSLRPSQKMPLESTYLRKYLMFVQFSFENKTTSFETFKDEIRSKIENPVVSCVKW